ncbi:MAG: HAD family phosphatase [Nanoarchaeota archaeon]
MIKAVIFDFNGVIIDTTPYIWEARNQYLSKYNIHLSIEEIKPLLGHSLKDQLDKINNKYNLNIDCEDFSKSTRDEVDHLLGKNMVPNKGVRELIADLQQHKIKTGIASLYPKELLVKRLRDLELLEKFPIMTALEDANGHKDSADILLKESDKLGVLPSECIFIDDSVHGILQAKELGMKFIGKVTQFHKADDFKGADLVVHSLEELNAEKILELR